MIAIVIFAILRQAIYRTDSHNSPYSGQHKIKNNTLETKLLCNPNNNANVEIKTHDRATVVVMWILKMV